MNIVISGTSSRDSLLEAQQHASVTSTRADGEFSIHGDLALVGGRLQLHAGESDPR